MTTENKDTPKAIAQKDLLRSMQELSLTLKALKVLACDLKNKSELASSKLNQNSLISNDTTKEDNTDQYTILH